MVQAMQQSEELQARYRHSAVKRQMAPILDEANKRFSDALYRLKHDDKRTAADVWAELKKAQNEPGMVSALRCVSILNELTRRGQIADDWRG